MRKLFHSLAFAASALSAGCGGSTDDDGTAGATGLGGVGGNNGGSVSSASGGKATDGGAPGSGGATQSGGSASGGKATSTPTGPFDSGKTVAVIGDRIAASLSITEDELELFFVHVLTDTSRPIMVLKRPATSVAFTDEPVEVSELRAVCDASAYPTLDVSNDGLRMYFTCLDGSSPLRLATRASRAAPWVVSESPIGTVADSIGVSDDELDAVAVVGLQSAVVPDSMPRPVLYRRAALSEAFGAPVPASIDQYFTNPDLGCGDRTLFGVINVGDVNRIAFSKPGASFGAYSAPSTEGMPVPPTSASGRVDDFTPTVTRDCSRIYFLRSSYGAGAPTYTIEVAERTSG